MAGDWIKMRVGLLNDPKVDYIAGQVFGVRVMSGECPAEVAKVSVIGALFVLWSMADQYTTDGMIRPYSADDLDRRVGIKGFAKALQDPAVGWLEVGDNYLRIPEFNAHNGRSAKDRAQDTKSKADRRKNASGKCPEANRTPAGPEKRREEKSNTPQPPKGGGDGPDAGNAEIPPIPSSLRTPEFEGAWTDYQRHRREKRQKLTPTAVRNLFAKMEPWGPARSIAALRHSMANGWTGVFEGGKGGGGDSRDGPGSQPMLLTGPVMDKS